MRVCIVEALRLRIVVAVSVCIVQANCAGFARRLCPGPCLRTSPVPPVPTYLSSNVRPSSTTVTAEGSWCGHVRGVLTVWCADVPLRRVVTFPPCALIS